MDEIYIKTTASTSSLAPVTGSFANQQSIRNPELLIQGNSGCRVQIKRQQSRLTVEKIAVDARYSARLKLQIHKQQRSRIDNTLPFIRIPDVLAEDERANCYRAEMEYVYFHDSLTFFGSASISAIDSVINMIFAYIDAEISKSILTKVPSQIVLEKIDSIRKNLQETAVISKYEPMIDWLVGTVSVAPNIEIPIGACHGDLTFSNIMIARDASSLALIDFLDSFLDSPIIDLAKIRQDTLFQWTLMMSGRIEDRIRFLQIMRYIDRTVTMKYRDYDWYKQNIVVFLALNMLRIAPYAQTFAVHEFILSCLNSLRISYD